MIQALLYRQSGILNKILHKYEVILSIPKEYKIPYSNLFGGEYVASVEDMKKELTTLNHKPILKGSDRYYLKLDHGIRLNKKGKSSIIKKIKEIESYNYREYCPGVKVLKRTTTNPIYNLNLCMGGYPTVLINYYNYYDVILVISSGVLVPERYKKYMVDCKDIDFSGFVDENNKTYTKTKGDTYLVLKNTYLIIPPGCSNRWERYYDEELVNKLRTIKNYNKQ